jgi:hypothetical protein
MRQETSRWKISRGVTITLGAGSRPWVRSCSGAPPRSSNYGYYGGVVEPKIKQDVEAPIPEYAISVNAS